MASVRRAIKEDSARIADIYVAARKMFLPYAPLAHAEGAVRSWVSERLLPAGNVTVILEGCDILGFVAISRDGFHGWIDHLYLDPSVVGRGLGALLLEEAKRLLAKPVRLYTFQENEDARRFYRRHGFREIAFSDGSLNEEKTPDVLMEWS